MNEEIKSEEVVVGKEGEVKKFSEIYRGIEFEGRKVEVDEILGKEIVITDFTELQGNYGVFVVCQAKLDNVMITFPIGSEVVLNQLRKIKTDNNIPILTKIEKRISEKTKRQYYTLT